MVCLFSFIVLNFLIFICISSYIFYVFIMKDETKINWRNVLFIFKEFHTHFTPYIRVYLKNQVRHVRKKCCNSSLLRLNSIGHEFSENRFLIGEHRAVSPTSMLHFYQMYTTAVLTNCDKKRENYNSVLTVYKRLKNQKILKCYKLCYDKRPA